MLFHSALYLALVIGLSLASTGGALPVARVGAINLDRFFTAFGDECNDSPEFKTFLSQLYERYSFEEGHVRLKTKVQIPDALRSAVGKATATNKGKWTFISVPIAGTFHGLRIRAFEFDAGHSNGIDVLTLVLDASFRDLDATLGKAVRETDTRLRAQAKNGEPDGVTPELKAIGRRSQIVCDRSD